MSKKLGRSRADTAAVIVAGGKGLRFGGRVRKQYLLLRRRPILWWSLSAFERSSSIRAVVLVVPSDDILSLRARARSWKFKKLCAVVAGGTTRADSVRRGLAAIPADCRYVAVHDAVRPLVTPEIIERVSRAARASKAALAACASRDTVKLAQGNDFVRQTPLRDTVWLAQTPQIFEKTILLKAHGLVRQTSGADGITDDAMLVEKLGVRVKLVESSPENIKVTLPIDFILAEHILRGRS